MNCFAHLFQNCENKSNYPELLKAIESEDWLQVTTLTTELIGKGDETIIKYYALASNM